MTKHDKKRNSEKEQLRKLYTNNIEPKVLLLNMEHELIQIINNCHEWQFIVRDMKTVAPK